MPQFVDKYLGKDKREQYAFTYFLQPLTDIHLHSNIGGEIEPNRDIGTVYIFSAAALFILLIACLNYINLAAARFAERAKEVGLRKVLGAVPAQLIRQFFGESFLYALSALPLAVLLAEILLPLSNSLWGKALSFHYFNNLFLLAGITGVILFVGLVPGIVPALFLSALQPIDALRGKIKSGMLSTFLRRRLVVFQFTISVLAIISTLVMAKQLHYIKTTDLGVNKENVINIAINHSEEVLLKYETIKYEFLQLPNVQAVSASCFFPGRPRWNMNYNYEGLVEGKNAMAGCISVDYDFIDTFKLNIVEGRGFSKEFPTDETSTFIVNEAARKDFGWESPIGKELNIADWKKGTIIGVVKDFHFNSLHKKIGPVVLYIEPPHFEYFSVRVNPANVPQTLNFLKDKWQKLVPSETFEYSFLSEDFDRLYSTETRLAKILMIIAILAIVVACLGLFGLSFFSAEQRKKEIGIRKVFGATATTITIMSAKEFARLVLIANLIAWPIAWYIMNNWLQNFAYRAGIEIWTFLLAGTVSLVISLLTISYKSIKAAGANPVDTLRYE